MFGHLYKHAKWGLVMAEFIEALVFGLVHLTQPHHSLGEALGILLIHFQEDFGSLGYTLSGIIIYGYQ